RAEAARGAGLQRERERRRFPLRAASRAPSPRPGPWARRPSRPRRAPRGREPPARAGGAARDRRRGGRRRGWRRRRGAATRARARPESVSLSGVELAQPGEAVEPLQQGFGEGGEAGAAAEVVELSREELVHLVCDL